MCVYLLIHSVCTVYCSTWFIDSVCKPVFLYYFSHLHTTILPSCTLSLSLSSQGSTESCNTTEEEDMKGSKGTLSTSHELCISFSGICRMGCVYISANMIKKRPLVSVLKALFTPDILIYLWFFVTAYKSLRCFTQNNAKQCAAFLSPSGITWETSNWDCLKPYNFANVSKVFGTTCLQTV